MRIMKVHWTPTIIDQGSLDMILIRFVDVLARLGIYLLSEPSPALIPLLRPLFTPASLPETLIVILLDWARPWDWIRQLKTWIRLLREIFTSLNDDCRRTLDDVTQAWENRRGTYADGGGGANIDGDVVIPLGPGEFDEPIGLPLCVVCQNVLSTGWG
jgi:dynein light intermediate chain 1